MNILSGVWGKYYTSNASHISHTRVSFGAILSQMNAA